MALDPLPWQTPPSGGRMSEEEYFALDERAFDAKYEYLNGVARLMSGGSIARADIAFNVCATLKGQFSSGPCHASNSDVRVMVGRKANGRPNYLYPDVTVSCNGSDRIKPARRSRRLS